MSPYIAPGARMGPCDIVARLGADRIGEVWRARDHLWEAKRTHPGQRAELMVKGRDAHSREAREFLHSKRLRVVSTKPRDRFRCSVAQVASRRDCPKRIA